MAAAASRARVAAAAAVVLVGAITFRTGVDDDDVAHAQQQQYPGAAADLSRWGSVGLPGGDTVYITKENFVACYDARTRNPKWVMERVSRATCTGDADRRVVGFKEEMSVDPAFRSLNVDYLNSGYDRGHMAPAANHRSSTQTMEETFTLANVSPQVGPGFNRDMWARVEKFTRDLTKRCEVVYLVSGPLFLPRRRHANEEVPNPASKAKFIMHHELLGDAPNLVSVPTHFFKVVLAEINGRRLLAAFVLPNAPIPPDVPLLHFLVPFENLERAAGFRFFTQYLTDEHRDLLDGRVPLLRGLSARDDPDIAGLLTNSSSFSKKESTVVVARRANLDGFGGGLRLNLDGPEHLCDVLACQLPPERFWEVPGKPGKGKKNGGNGGGGANTQMVGRPHHSFPAAWWPWKKDSH